MRRSRDYTLRLAHSTCPLPLLWYGSCTSRWIPCCSHSVANSPPNSVPLSTRMTCMIPKHAIKSAKNTASLLDVFVSNTRRKTYLVKQHTANTMYRVTPLIVITITSTDQIRHGPKGKGCKIPLHHWDLCKCSNWHTRQLRVKVMHVSYIAGHQYCAHKAECKRTPPT